MMVASSVVIDGRRGSKGSIPISPNEALTLMLLVANFAVTQ